MRQMLVSRYQLDLSGTYLPTLLHHIGYRGNGTGASDRHYPLHILLHELRGKADVHRNSTRMLLNLFHIKTLIPSSKPHLSEHKQLPLLLKL